MKALNLFLLLAVAAVHGKGWSDPKIQSSSDWPIDCQTSDIDLVFISDNQARRANYKKQTKFFSELIDVFSPSTEVNLTRVRVALVTSTMNRAKRSPAIDVRIELGSIHNKTQLKEAIEADNPLRADQTSMLHAIQEVIFTVFNRSINGVRDNTVHAIVMVQDRILQDKIDPADIHRLLLEFNVKFYLIVTSSEVKNEFTDLIPLQNRVFLKDLRSLHEMQHIPLSICRLCASGWFKTETTNDQDTRHLSCFKFSTYRTITNWLDANANCKEHSAELASIETRAQLSLLRSHLSTEILASTDMSPQSNSSFPIFIGLKRRDSHVGQRFRWLSKMPLTYTHWAKDQPKGGGSIACAVWSFTKIGHPQAGKNDSMPEGYSSDLRDGWIAVGCGFLHSRFSLCKSLTTHSPSWQPSNLRSIKLPKPNSESIRNAFIRGELAHVQGSTLVYSTSALLSGNRHSMSQSFAIVGDQRVETISLDSVVVFWCDNFTSIPYNLVCDDIPHCPDHQDERDCFDVECDGFECHNHQCLPPEVFCDLYPDCADGSDELDCVTCPHGRCPNGRCLPKPWLMDGETDCSVCSLDNTDNVTFEYSYMLTHGFAQCLFTCNRTECVYPHMLNDGVVDCTGPEGPIDETIGALELTHCYSEKDDRVTNYTNWGPRCVYIKDRFGETLGCRDMSHLENCNNFVCPEGYFKCPDSFCIPVHYLKNSEYDCARGEDEDMMALECDDYFKCSSSDICLHPDRVCDTEAHCPQGDDEINCNMSCRDGFLCIGSTITVKGYDKTVPLTDISFIDSRTKYLDLSGVNVDHLFQTFPIMLLHNVIDLNLADCSFVSVPGLPPGAGYFRPVQSVQRFDISHNLLTEIGDSSIIRSMRNLRVLNVSHNKYLKSIHSDSFNTVVLDSRIRILDLSYTGLTYIGSDVFIYLKNLQDLSLRNTRITNFSPDLFPPGYKLETLDLRGLTFAQLYPGMFKNVTIGHRLFTDSFKICCPQIHNEEMKPSVCVTAKDPFSSCSDLMSDTVFLVFLWFNGFVAVVGNVIVIIYRMFVDRTFFRMAYGHFVIHLGFADLLMGTYLLIIGTADVFYRGRYIWIEYVWRNSAVCAAAGFISTLSSETSTLFIALITLDRFLAVKYPFGQVKFYGRTVTFSCCLAWFVGLIIAVIPILPLFQHWELYNTNGMCLGIPLTGSRRPGWHYATAIFIFFNFFLFILIAMGQVAIYRSISASKIRQGKVSSGASRRSRDQMVAMNLSIVVVTDFLCWFPVTAMGLVALAGYDIGLVAYAWSAVLILPVNSAINPILYTIPAVVHSARRLTHMVSNTKISHNSKSQ